MSILNIGRWFTVTHPERWRKVEVWNRTEADDDYADLFEPAAERSAIDLYEIVRLLAEWRDSRQACLNLGGTDQPTTHEGRLARQAMWGRYSKAESALMACANRLDHRFDGPGG